jgi:hypothetical protein
MKNVYSLEQTLAANLPWHTARIKYVAAFLLALVTVKMEIPQNYYLIAYFWRLPVTSPALPLFCSSFILHFRRPPQNGRLPACHHP